MNDEANGELWYLDNRLCTKAIMRNDNDEFEIYFELFCE